MMIKDILLIGIGGGVGSILRYATHTCISRHWGNQFPWGTLLVNVLGCFLIGLFIGLFERFLPPHPSLRLLFITGFCGGYTTFSTFAAENIGLFQSGNLLSALAYIGVSIVLGILAVWIGVVLIVK